MLKRVLIFSIGFLCAWAMFSMGLQKVTCQTNMSANVLFSADSSNFYFLDKDESKVYKYNTQGKLIRTYTIKELGKDFLSR